MMLKAISEFKMEMVRLGAEYDLIINHINDSILSLIEDYMQQSSEFVSKKIITKQLKDNHHGYYVHGTNCITLNNKHARFNENILTNDISKIQFSIEVCLHECRHAFQEKYNYLIDESKEYYAEFDMQSLTEIEKHVVYTCDPMEIDARQKSKQYTTACYEYIVKHLEEELEHRLNNRRILMEALV